MMEREKRVVPLKHPIQAHGHDVDQLTIQEPTAKELEAMDRGAGQIQKANHLLAACASVPYPSILQLRAGDYIACMGAIEQMGFQVPPEGSAESSPESQPGGATHSE